jgi:hypothetical protein
MRENRQSMRGNRARYVVALIGAGAVILAAFIARQVIVFYYPGPTPTVAGSSGGVATAPGITPVPMAPAAKGAYLENLAVVSGAVPHRGLADEASDGGQGSTPFAHSIWYSADQMDGARHITSTFPLSGRFHHFSAHLGLGTACEPHGLCGFGETFEVWVDGVRLVQQVVKSTDEPYDLQLDVPGGASRLELLMDLSSDPAADQPIWGDALLT